MQRLEVELDEASVE